MKTTNLKNTPTSTTKTNKLGACSTSDTGKKAIDNVIDTFISLFSEKIESLSKDWSQPWVSPNTLPVNIIGRKYQGINELFLSFYSSMKGFELPIFLTFKQAKELGLSVLKGAKSFPVYYYSVMEIENDNLEEAEDKKIKKIPYVKTFRVFNIEQTDIKEALPEKWCELKRLYPENVLNNESDFICAPLDNLVSTTEAGVSKWICPIYEKRGDIAAFNMVRNDIVLPMRGQFSEKVSFYSTMLHEMTHSTMIKTNRFSVKDNSDLKLRAKEELIAELGAALTSVKLGFATGMRDENKKYIANWMQFADKDPKIIKDVVMNVMQAVDIISENLQIA